jgi:hypothetical protein
MPSMISHIDEIGRDKQRDVLTIEFHCHKTGFLTDFVRSESRKTILDWLAVNDIPHYLCGPFADDIKMDRYRGQIYIDVPNDMDNPLFLKVSEILGNPDGSAKFANVYFIRYSLAQCMANVHHTR